jgi:hypothetical protein
MPDSVDVRPASSVPQRASRIARRHRVHDLTEVASCAWCDRIRVGDRWLDAADAMDLLPPTPEGFPHSFPLTSCADCLERLERLRAKRAKEETG